MAEELKLDACDAVIVGAGPAGLMIAARLAEAGKKVVILEAGPAWAPGDLVSSQIWSRRLKGFGANQLEGRNPVAVNFNAGWGTGGSLIHQYANWPRLHPEDFKVRSAFGKGLDWPIRYEDLQPFYDRIQAEVGLSGDAAQEIWRPPGEPYPMPPVKVFAHAEKVAAGFRKLGLRVAPAPVAINSVPYKGRPACIYDAWCDAGCPTGALANPFFTYLPQARKAGVEIRNHATVSRVLTDAKGDRVQAVEYFDSRTRVRAVQRAELVILAAFTGQTPRILLNSATDRHPRGLANSHDQVGRHIMTHFGASAYGLFDEDLQNYMGLSAAQLISQDGYAKSQRSDALGSYTWMIGAAQKPNDFTGLANARVPVFGAALHDFMRRASRGLTKISAVMEALPHPDNRIVLSDRKDAFGFPIARIVHSLDEDALRLFEQVRAEGLRIMQATGAAEVWAPPGPPPLLHFIGGTPMGSRPEESVTDSYGRTHDIPNLFIAGAGLYPTEGAVHPSFTLHALALRTAEHLVQHWGSVAA
jgi:choline dehydrogenase-like flavoprotein